MKLTSVRFGDKFLIDDKKRNSGLGQYNEGIADLYHMLAANKLNPLLVTTTPDVYVRQGVPKNRILFDPDQVMTHRSPTPPKDMMLTGDDSQRIGQHVKAFDYSHFLIASYLAFERNNAVPIRVHVE